MIQFDICTCQHVVCWILVTKKLHWPFAGLLLIVIWQLSIYLFATVINSANHARCHVKKFCNSRKSFCDAARVQHWKPIYFCASMSWLLCRCFFMGFFRSFSKLCVLSISFHTTTFQTSNSLDGVNPYDYLVASAFDVIWLSVHTGRWNYYATRSLWSPPWRYCTFCAGL